MVAAQYTRPTPARVRYDRMSALLLAMGVTFFAFLAGIGTFGPVSAEGAPATPPTGVGAAPAVQTRIGQQRAGLAVETSVRHEAAAPRSTDEAAADPDGSKVAAAVPAGSGTGRRVVFDMSAQRVWLMGSRNTVLRTYLVSGSVTDNLRPGRYEVYSRSLRAVGVDDSGTMRYFVRFTRGRNAAIGFHDIPVDRGRFVQTAAQLGTPQSHGCIRQYRPDAIRLWNFAPVGTSVSVVA